MPGKGELHFLRAVNQRQENTCCGSRVSDVGSSRGGRHRRGSALCQPDDARIGDLPAEGLHLTPLREMLFQKDGAARVSHERAGSRKEDVTGTIMNLNAAAKQKREPGHDGLVWPIAKIGSIVRLGGLAFGCFSGLVVPAVVVCGADGPGLGQWSGGFQPQIRGGHQKQRRHKAEGEEAINHRQHPTQHAA